MRTLVEIRAGVRRCMPMNEIADRLEEFKKSGLIAEYEVLVADDSVRTRIVAPPGEDAGKLKAFIVEALGSLLSESQVNVEEAPV